MKRRIFSYWVNKEGCETPAYIELCMQTWHEHIPDLELIIIDHSNIREWAGDVIDYSLFFQLPPMHQSDIASFVILAKHGGIFMDADTIVTRDIFEEFSKFDTKSLVAFGYPNTANIHLAILVALDPNNAFVTAAADMATQRLNSAPTTANFVLNWDTFGNSIILEVAKDNEIMKLLHVLDRKQTGNMLEAHYFTGSPPMDQYMKFYFSSHKIKLKEVVRKIKFGAVSLHNSYTPEYFKNYTKEQVLEADSILSALLKNFLPQSPQG